MKTLLEQVAETGNQISSARHDSEHLGSFHGLSYSDVFDTVTNRLRDGWKVIGGNTGLKTVWLEYEDGTTVFFHIPS